MFFTKIPKEVNCARFKMGKEITFSQCKEISEFSVEHKRRFGRKHKTEGLRTHRECRSADLPYHFSLTRLITIHFRNE